MIIPRCGSGMNSLRLDVPHIFYLVVFGVDICPVSQEFCHRGRLACVSGHVERRISSVVAGVCRCAIILEEEPVVHHAKQVYTLALEM